MPVTCPDSLNFVYIYHGSTTPNVTSQTAKGHIELFCPQRQNFLKRYKVMAAAKLQTGAMIFGETHGTPDARSVLCDLIREGHIHKIFLESNDEVGLNEKAGKYLRKRLGENLENHQDWKSTILPYISAMDNNLGNPLSFATVIQLAVKNNVEVYFYDNYRAKSSSDGPTTQKGMTRRNNEMASMFKASGSPVGAVLLVGHQHEVPTGTNNFNKNTHSYNNTLRGQCGLAFDRSIKFSPSPWVRKSY